jgi:hypothetical protein
MFFRVDYARACCLPASSSAFYSVDGEQLCRHPDWHAGPRGCRGSADIENRCVCLRDAREPHKLLDC